MSSVFFGGRLYTTPTTASAVVDDAMLNSNLTTGNVVVLAGRSSGGKPLSPLRFGTPEQARATLVSGELLDACLAAFAPSNETSAPSEVVAVRINPALQAVGALKNSSSANVVTLTSIGYGQRENQIKVKVETGSTSGRRITTQRGADYFTADNVGRPAFAIRYTGGLASANITVAATTVTLEAPNGTNVATIDLNEFPDVQALCDRISIVTGFLATPSADAYTKPALNGLDFVTAADVKTAELVVRADLQAVVDWLNGALQGYVRATRVTNAGTIPAVSSFTFLTGGSDGVTTIDSWAAAFEFLQTVDAQWVVPVSPLASVHALASSHVSFMSTIGRRERRAIVGTDINTTDTAAIAAAKLLNSDRVSLVHLGHYDYGTDGKLKLLPPYISAARIAGGFAGVSPGTPLTNKNFRCFGLERELRNPTDTDPLLNGGVFCLENTEEGYKVVQSVSTWLINDNYNRVEVSCGVAQDYTARTIRTALNVLKGQKANPLLLQRAMSITKTSLTELARAEPQGPGILVGDDANPAFRNIRASIENDVVRVDFECSPVLPANYILATIYAVPFSGVAIAA